MMKSMLIAVAGAASLTAAAQATWGLKFEVSTDGGATWQSSVNATPGETVTFRFGSYFSADNSTSITTADGTGYAWALTRFTGQNQAAGLGAGDIIQNITLKTTNGNANVKSVTGNLIGTTAITSFASNLYIGGLPASPTYYDAIYTGEIVVSASAVSHVITMMNKQFGSGSTAGLTFYSSASLTSLQSAAPSGNSPARTDITATINVQAVPAPASLALLGLGGLVAARRRRA
jgi:hypothetical protein